MIVDQDLRERFLMLAAPMPLEQRQWRQDGKPTQRGSRYYARFVAYIDPRTVQQRLDEVFPGDWSLVQTVLPERGDEDGVAEVTMKATLTILGLTRECVGTGSNYKNAASDAFKRAAVRFGIASELYDLDTNWVLVDGDSKYAKALEDPEDAYQRRQARAQSGATASASEALPDSSSAIRSEAVPPGSEAVPAPPVKPKPQFATVACPRCGGKMWDNRATRKGKQPHYKCRLSPKCDGAIWLADDEAASAGPGAPYDDASYVAVLTDDQDSLPF